ncbi:MAG: hypothetical protein M1836_000778 [Candelina mexicana]|nr:MAG: hypothetical protein M1836_000778 [Candelina mexicana]
MSSKKYAHVIDSPQPSDIELLALPPVQDKFPSTKAEVTDRVLGQPHRKPYLNTVDLLAVSSSLACLVISVFVVAPQVAPTLFLILEARWGSRLQTYDAILRNTAVLSQTGLLWRVIILSLIVLPLALGAAYKRFTNGRSSIAMTTERPGYYGARAPLINFNNLTTNSIYLMMDATLPFMIASSNDSHPPPLTELPRAYGYNILLLDNSSVAVLDMPMPDYIASIRQHLAPNSSDSWSVSASVDAVVARYNTSGKMYIDDDAFWNDTYSNLYGDLNIFHLFNGFNLGLLFGNWTESDGATCFLGTYEQKVKTEWLKFANDPQEPDSVGFRSTALMFNTRRERCHGTWEITYNTIYLTNGSCTGVLTAQEVLQDHPHPLDAMPVQLHALTQYSLDRKNTPWLLPAFATQVATMYWARFVFIQIKHPNFPSIKKVSRDLYYNATDESIFSTRTTLNAHWLLYVVLAVQPFLVIVMFLSATLLFSTPISEGFGLVAILAGIDRDSLDVVQGAALSGKLKKPVRLDIAVCQDKAIGEMCETGHIVYTLGGEEHKGARLEHGNKYS